MRDGRAYWGAAMVLWCILYPKTQMVMVEQPDTIGHDYFPIQRLKEEGIEVHELRTSWFGDQRDKYVRLTTRNVDLAWPAKPRKKPSKADRRIHLSYVDADERDLLEALPHDMLRIGSGEATLSGATRANDIC